MEMKVKLTVKKPQSLPFSADEG